MIQHANCDSYNIASFPGVAASVCSLVDAPSDDCNDTNSSGAGSSCSSNGAEAPNSKGGEVNKVVDVLDTISANVSYKKEFDESRKQNGVCGKVNPAAEVLDYISANVSSEKSGY